MKAPTWKPRAGPQGRTRSSLSFQGQAWGCPEATHAQASHPGLSIRQQDPDSQGATSYLNGPPFLERNALLHPPANPHI